MKALSFTTHVAWFLLNSTIGFSLAHPAASELTSQPISGREVLGSFEVFSRSTSAANELDITDIPPCGIKCLIQHVSDSGCSLTDTLCICTNIALGQAVSACMLSNCTIADNIGTARVNADMCMLSNESQRGSVIRYTIAVYTVALTLVTLRIASKIVSKRLAWNDVPVVAAVVLAAVPIGCVLAMSKIGFGEHLWNLADDTFLPILRYFFIAWSTYVVILGLIKLSLIMFYLEVFPTRSFKIIGWIVFWYIAINTIVILLLTIFACTPVPAFWNRDLKGKCMDIQMLGYANSISAIVQDVILFILPMSYLRNLQMKRSRKVAVAIMFLIGSFGCVTTIIRLRTLLLFKISYDPSWDYVPIVIWTELEVSAAFACISLPAIRVLLVKLTPKQLKGWLSEVTHGSSHQTLRRAADSHPPKREWHMNDTWINLASTEHNERGVNEKIGFLPSAETSTSQLKTTELSSTSNWTDSRSPKVGLNEVLVENLGYPPPRQPVSVKSKFSS